MPLLKTTTLFRSLALLAALCVPALAHAQDQRLRVSIGGATTAAIIDSEPAVFASVGYRFADRLSFDVEVTAIDDAADRFRNIPFLGQGGGPGGVVRLGSMMTDKRRGKPGQAPSVGTFNLAVPIGFPVPPGGLRIEHDGRTALATFGFRYEFASQVTRFLPYVSGGIGMSRTEESFNVSLAGAPGRPGIAGRPDVNIDEEVSHNGLATSAGVGASIRLFGQLSADLDARYFRLDRGRNLGRLGGGFSYRF